MEDRNKTRKQLVDELQVLRRRIAELQASETEFKRVEIALRESERRSRALFDQT